MHARIARTALGLTATVAAAAVLAACGSSSSSPNKLSLVAYSTPQSAYQALIPAFQATPQGKGLSFTQSYGASGDQSRAVLAGLPTDVVNLSLEPDVTKLVSAGLVSPSWNQGPTKGIVTNSVTVLVVRRGNPKHIATWDDLVKPGVQVVTPNPVSSGSARWNVMAAYGAQLKAGKTQAQALAYVKSLLKNTVAQPTSARNALQTFLAGKGDVLLDYENDAIAAIKKDAAISYVIPSSTILIQNPIAVSTKGNTAKAQTFVDWLLSTPAQKIWVSKGFRSVIPSLNDPAKFPTPTQLFTIDYVGGWKKVTKAFFDPASGSVTQIEQSLGVSTGK